MEEYVLGWEPHQCQDQINLDEDLQDILFLFHSNRDHGQAE